MPSIFELTESQRKLMNAVEAGELSEEDAADTFEGAEHELNEKLSDYCTVIRAKQLTSDNLQSEIDRLSKLKSENENEVKRMKSAMILGLSTINRTKFDTGMFKGHIRKGAESLKVTDSTLVPAEYVETVVTEKVDKAAAKKAMMAGEELPGCEIVTGSDSIILK